MKTKTVGVVLINNNKVLLVKHLESSNHVSDTYGLPAGHVEIGEKNIDAAIRELKEETGLTVKTIDLVPLPLQYEATIERKNGKEDMTMEVFLCLNYSGELIDSDETSPFWIEISQLNNYNLIINVNNAIQQALRIVH